MMTCPNCGRTVPGNVCPSCGQVMKRQNVVMALGGHILAGPGPPGGSNAYTITFTIGSDGSCKEQPGGPIVTGPATRTAGYDYTFGFTADEGYYATYKLDAADAVTADSYTFTNLAANHTLEVIFEEL